MAKQCIYCGQPLPRDDARFCKDCGQSQVSPDGAASAAESASIRVKLPPKEYVRDDPSAPKTPVASEQSADSVPPFPRTQAGQQPARLPKRPTRPTSQEVRNEGAQSGTPHAEGLIYSKVVRSQSEPSTISSAQPSTPAQASRDASEESTMVLPGWQKELERLRDERMAANLSATPEEQAPLAVPAPGATSRRPRYTPVPEALSSPSQMNSGADQPGRVPDEHARAAGQPQRELHTRVGGQEPASQPSTQKRVPEPGPAPAVEQTPFSALSFGAEERERDLADVETVTWEVADHSSPTQKPTTDEYATQVVEEKSSEGAVEDLPTSALNIAAPAKDQQPLKIERTSTPQSASGPSAQTDGQRDEVEELPTRPMPASFAEPRTPLPPSRLADLPPLEKRFTPLPANLAPGFGPSGRSPNPPSRPGNPPSQPGFGASNPPSRPGNPPSQPGFGPSNPPSRPGNPSSQPGFGPSNPPSQPGNPPSWPGAQTGGPGPASRPRASLEQLPNTPRPVSTASGRTRNQRRVGLIAVILLLLLVIGGSITWYVRAQPFTNQVAHDQVYQNTSLGFSLHYPLSWKASFNQVRSVVRFIDSSATVQVSLSRAAAASGSTLNQYLSQQAALLDLTSQKAGPAVSFAGENWQQLQGSENQSGATYKVTVYVTQHNGHFYALICLTPPGIYAQAEHDSFAPLRASLQFL